MGKRRILKFKKRKGALSIRERLGLRGFGETMEETRVYNNLKASIAAIPKAKRKEYIEALMEVFSE